MRSDDTVAFKAGVAKRITFSTPARSSAAYARAALLLGPSLFDSLAEVFPFLHDLNAFDPFLAERCMLENESNRLAVKSRAALNGFRSRSEPEWEMNFVDLSAKSELKAKDEKRFGDAIPSQTLITAHDYILHRLGWVARYISASFTSRMPANIMFYLGKSPSDLDAFCKRFWTPRRSSWNDFSAYDQGQDESFLACEASIMRSLGIPSSEIDFYVWLKCNTKSRLGSFAVMRFTGEVFTFIFNTLANVAISNLRYFLPLTSPMCFGGDDSCFNFIPVERPTWAYYGPRLTLQFKAESGDHPSFVSWFLTPLGIYKSPVLLWTRLQAAIARGLYSEVVLSYLYEFAFGYRLGDALTDYCTPDEADASSLLTRFFLRQRRLPLYMLSSGMDVPTNIRPNFYSTPHDTLLDTVLSSSLPSYLLSRALSLLSSRHALTFLSPLLPSTTFIDHESPSALPDAED
jgi:hypothetical protein